MIFPSGERTSLKDLLGFFCISKFPVNLGKKQARFIFSLDFLCIAPGAICVTLLLMSLNEMSRATRHVEILSMLTDSRR